VWPGTASFVVLCVGSHGGVAVVEPRSLVDIAMVVDQEGVCGVARPGADGGGVVSANVAGGVVCRGGARAPRRAGGAGGATDALERDEEEGEHGCGDGTEGFGRGMRMLGGGTMSEERWEDKKKRTSA
jgi:hypothetical protein